MHILHKPTSLPISLRTLTLFTSFAGTNPANHIIGDVTKIVRSYRRAFDAAVYDLGVGPSNTCILVPRQLIDRKRWLDIANEHANDGVPSVFKYLGPLRPGLDDERITADAEMQLADMQLYNMLLNNCYVFVNKMYTVEKLYD